MNVELQKFRVKPGMSEKTDEWLRFLNEHMTDTLLTLEGEKMFVESIHRETVNGIDYLYWYSIQGPGGSSVYESDSPVDKIHLQYWAECIDDSYHGPVIPAKVVMIPNKVRRAME